MAKKTAQDVAEPTFQVTRSPGLPKAQKGHASLKPNPLHESVVESLNTGEALFVPVDTTDENTVKAVKNYLQRARQELDCGLSVRVDGEGVHFLAKPDKKQYKYTVDDIRTFYGLDAGEKVSPELRAAYREEALGENYDDVYAGE